MDTFKIVIKNLKTNFSFYLLYLVSITFVITIFFAFTSFSLNEVMLEKISTDGRVETMCNIISIFLMIFVVFYMTYSNRFFLRRRTKELGIYTLLGYRKSAILRLLTLENLLICCSALVIGIFIGSIMHKGIIQGITTLLQLTIPNSKIPFIESSAVIKTASFILLIIFILAASNRNFLYKTPLIDLVRFEKSAEGNLNFRKLPALLGLIMTISGYCLALDILRGSNSVWITIGFSPIGLLTLLLVVIGTILFIASFLPYVLQRSKCKKKSFYTETKIITTPNFIYHIRSNTKTVIMLTLLSAATLTISGVMALTVYYPIAAVSRMAPSEIEFRIEQEGQIEGVKNIVSKYTSDHNDLQFTKTDIYKVTSSSAELPPEYSIGTAKGDSENERILREPGFECISFSDYLTLLEAQSRLKNVSDITQLHDNECILIKYQPNGDKSIEAGTIYPLLINGKETKLTVKEVNLDNVISFANSIGTLVVSDAVYKEICMAQSPSTSIFSINGSSIKENKNLYYEINRFLNNSPYLQGNSHRIHNLFSLNSSTFLLIGFLVVLFFIASGSILYFNNISTISDSKSDYEILRKMGFTNKKIHKIIRKQVFGFFCIPFLFGLLDCIFATIVYKYGLMQNLLGNSLSQYIPVAAAVALTAAIYLIYYLLTVRKCYNLVKDFS